jgi:molybdopterin molybdotransferase
MLTVSEAFDLILHEIWRAAPVACALSDAFGHVLQTDVRCEDDSPPFDKALMDGYAVVAADVRIGRELTVVEEVIAGRVPTQTVASGQATRIMTGAPIPDGANAVVRVELTELLDGEPQRVRINSVSAAPEQDLIRRGTNKRAGDLVVPAGRCLRAQELAALAEMGQHTLNVTPRPDIAVLATGDELVSVDASIGPGQIRNSNETMLVAQIRAAGGNPMPLGIARDSRDDLREHIERGLQNDILLLSGGVSAGKLDLVPSELERAGVRQVFHKVRVKPGKPVWFGMLDDGDRTCCVFGLPGNPVSSMVCFELFVRTAIRQMTGVVPVRPQSLSARLKHSHSHKDDRETYFPAVVDWTSDGPVVSLMNWHGSSDLQSTVDANAMAVFPAEARNYATGESVDIVLW